MNNTNSNFINNLKTKNISLANFYVKDNILFYAPKYNVFLGSVDLSSLNNDIFTKLSADEIFFVISCICMKVNKPDFTDKKIVYMNKLLKLPILEDEHFKYILEYLSDYYNREQISEKVSWEDELGKLKAPIENAYDETDKIVYFHPGCTFVRKVNEKHYENKFSNSSSNGNNKGNSNEKALQKVRQNGMKKVSVLDASAAFASATLVITITSSIAIVIAIIAFYLSF